VGPRNHVLYGGPDPAMGRGNFEGEGASHCKLYGHSAVISAKAAELIEMSFGLWAQMGRRNHVLDGGPEVLRDVAMAINFGTICSNWLFTARAMLALQALY